MGLDASEGEYVKTGIFIRAQVDGRWGSFDIGDERIPSEHVVQWLRSRGGFNPYAENLVLSFIGRDQVAHDIPTYAPVNAVDYRSGTILVECVQDEIRVAAKTPHSAIKISEPRVYNALISLVQAIHATQVEDEATGELM